MCEQLHKSLYQYNEFNPSIANLAVVFIKSLTEMCCLFHVDQVCLNEFSNCAAFVVRRQSLLQEAINCPINVFDQHLSYFSFEHQLQLKSYLMDISFLRKYQTHNIPFRTYYHTHCQLDRKAVADRVGIMTSLSEVLLWQLRILPKTIKKSYE